VIHCPFDGCDQVFTDQDIEKAVGSELYSKFYLQKQKVLVNQNPKLRWCSRIGCENYMAGDQENLRLQCVCGQEICFNCKDNWHEGRTCEEMLKHDYNKDIDKKKLVKLCPQCKTKGEKIDGCDHIACPMCSYNYCWLCQGEYNSSHMSETSLTRCRAKDWVSIQRREKFRKCLHLVGSVCSFILGIIIGIVLFPFYLLYSSSAVCFLMVEKKTRVIQILFCVLGMVCFPLPLLILAGCVLIKTQCLDNRWVNHLVTSSTEYICCCCIIGDSD